MTQIETAPMRASHIVEWNTLCTLGIDYFAMCLLETQACIEYKNHLWKEKRENKKRSPKKDKLLQFSFEVGYYSWISLWVIWVKKSGLLCTYQMNYGRVNMQVGKYSPKCSFASELCFPCLLVPKLIQISSILLFPLSIKQMSAGSICVSLISMYSTHLKLESCLILIQLIC